ncbi:MAG TPA: apolipoprotein N-acyltransferase [Actinomycetota bacterium]|nr:apolipoprotein N-acyltransferase [Actinomycetota bacterium]
MRPTREENDPAPIRDGRGRRLAAVAVSGAALTLAFPEPDIAPLAWLCLAPLLAALAGTGAKRGFLFGATFGLCFFGTLLYWVGIVGYLAWAVLVLLQALYLGVFGALWGAASRRTGRAASIVLPALLWVGVVEYLRAVTPVVGFTWGQLAQSQHDLPLVLRSAGWGGSWLVAFQVVVVNALVAAAASAVLRRELRGAAVRGVAAVAVLLAAAPLPVPRADGPPVDVAIVQGNIPEHRPASYEKDLVIIDNHVRLTRTVPPEADLILWPESSVGIDPARDREVADALRTAARDVGRPLIVGGTLSREDGDYQVMAYLVSAEGEIVDAYQKTHLVPFGEYVPARAALDWLPALEQVPLDAVPGEEPVVFDVAGGVVAPVISFEADFGSLVARRIEVGGRLLVVLTNTSTWRHSWASAQHVAMSQVRAAETGVFVAHGALTGISAFVAPSGEVIERSELWEPDVLMQTVRFATQASVYALSGDWAALGALAGAAVWAAILLARGSRRTTPLRRTPS